MKISNLSRRSFIQGSGLVLAGTAAGSVLPWLPSSASAADSVFAPNVYLSIATDGQVTIVAHRSEMGQGIRTALTQILADELDAQWSRTSVEQATGDKKYGDQNTDGSKSIRLFYDVLRHAGASAREMLVSVAARRWGVVVTECTVAEHRVSHAASGRSFDFGELASDAAALPVPAKVEFKPRQEQRFIGKPMKNIDAPQVVQGGANFGADVVLDNMVHAVVVRCPHLGGKAEKFHGPEGQPGFLGLEAFDPPAQASLFLPKGGVAVIADSTWHAVKYAQSLQVAWSDSDALAFDSDAFQAELREMVQQPAKVVYDRGNVDKTLEQGVSQLEATYETPFLAHAPMEPPVALASVHDGVCEVWAPVQDPQDTRTWVARWLKLPEEKITINVTMLGGAFGRKSKPDFVLEAVELSRRLQRPVRVTWRREDDIQHDYYHAASAQYHRASLDADGRPLAWLQRTAFPTISSTFSLDATEPSRGELEMGFSNLPYRVENQRYESTGKRCGIRIGWMRSVCNIFHSFSSNVFADEMASAANADPINYRLGLLEGLPDMLEVPGDQAPAGHAMDISRVRDVIKAVRGLSNWDGEHSGSLGFAVHHSFRSYVATVVEVHMNGGQVVVDKAWVALDCGTYVNPDTCKAQMEGAVMFGLSLALSGKITTQDGAVQQDNFDGYPVLRMYEAPEVEVVQLDSDALPAGVGEPGVPPVAPALVNAIYAATGNRHRSLPIGLK